MSPVSRKRKKQPSRRPDPTLDDLGVEVVASYEETLTASAFDVELFTSDLLGVWWQQAVEGGADTDRLPLAVVRYAGRQRTPEALATLLALARLAPGEAARQAASDAASRLRAAGVAEPPWAADLGPAELGRCAQVTDVYGEQTTLACAFTRAGEQHAMVVLLDHDELGGEVLDAWFSAEPSSLFDEIADQAAGSEGLASFAEADPEQCAVLLRRGFALQDDALEVPDSEEFVQFRALALARVRDMPGPTEVDLSLPDEIGDDELDTVLNDFLAAPEAAELLADADEGAVEDSARLITEFGADEDEQPLRITPGRLDRLLHSEAPAEELDDGARAAFPAVVLAWTRYAARLAALPEGAVADLVQIATECGNHVNEEDHGHSHAAGADLDRLIEQYLPELDQTDLDETPEPADVAEQLERRMFVVPEATAEVDGVLVTLDPAAAADRRLLILGEHPEFADDPEGAEPAAHIALHETVADQLWRDEPPELWQAATRLLDGGAERMDVLHTLADVAARHGDGKSGDYAAELANLGR